MEVMLNSGDFLVPVAAWQGTALSVNPAVRMEGETRVLLCGGGVEQGAPRVGVLVQHLMPWAGTFVADDGSARKVQSFRYVSMDGAARALLWCASCGRQRVAPLESLGKTGMGDCPECGMVPTGAPCPRMHNWGLCPECEDGPGTSIAKRSREGASGASATPGGGPPDPSGGALGSLAGSAAAAVEPAGRAG